MCRDGKSLQNSTGKTLSLKNLHTKYVQKVLNIMQKFAKMPKKYTKKGNNHVKYPKLVQL